MRLIISGGGTGGHVYPALAAVQALRQQVARLDPLWVGSLGGLEQALVERAGLTFEAIPAAGLRGKNPLAVGAGLWLLGQGFRQSRAIIRRFQPDVLFITGGYVCVPVTLAAYRAGVPIIIYLPDIEPGLAIKFLARFASRVAVTTPEAQRYFRPGLTAVTGYPVRSELWRTVRDLGKAGARQWLGLEDDLPVLLVFGGSQGARSINQTLTGELAAYLDVCQIVHVTGKLDINEVRERHTALPRSFQRRYHVSAYLHDEMAAALVAADLVVSRAGASVLGEFPAVGLPAVLVPGPYAGAHQGLNAAYLARYGAAVVVADADLRNKLRKTVIELITHEEKLQLMSQASRDLANPRAAFRLAEEIARVGDYG